MTLSSAPRFLRRWPLPSFRPVHGYFHHNGDGSTHPLAAPKPPWGVNPIGPLRVTRGVFPPHPQRVSSCCLWGLQHGHGSLYLVQITSCVGQAQSKRTDNNCMFAVAEKTAGRSRPLLPASSRGFPAEPRWWRGVRAERWHQGAPQCHGWRRGGSSRTELPRGRKRPRLKKRPPLDCCLPSCSQCLNTKGKVKSYFQLCIIYNVQMAKSLRFAFQKKYSNG